MSNPSPKPVILAPMAGVTDTAMRELCLEQGADLAFCEMVSSKGLSYANDKTRGLLDLAPCEDTVGVQLFGHEPEIMAQEARWVEETLGPRLAVIDINMGCPARKIVSKGDGAALMKEPELAATIASAVKEAVTTPVSAKFRRGYTLGEDSAVEFAKRLEDAGVDRITVHGRYAEQLYRGSSDRETIASVKEAVSIPVIGNGDIRSGADARSMLEETGCDGVMVARGAEGNPWIFADIKATLSGEPFAPPTPHERIAMARRHAALLDGLNKRAIVRMRKHACWYVAGMPGAAAMRDRINHCCSLKDFEELFDEVESYAP